MKTEKQSEYFQSKAEDGIFACVLFDLCILTGNTFCWILDDTHRFKLLFVLPKILFVVVAFSFESGVIKNFYFLLNINVTQNKTEGHTVFHISAVISL